MNKYDIRISGQGGQGVILTGIIIGKAVAIFEDRHATLIQAFGPEARGSTVSAQLMVSDEPIAYPYIRTSDILLAYCRESYEKFSAELTENGVLIYDDELVQLDETLGKGVQKFGIPAMRLAEEKMGKRLAFNMIMCGYFAQVTRVVAPSSLRDAIADSVPKDSTAFNLKAFELGLAFSPDI